MNNKFLRQWTMLRHVPRYPAKTTTRALNEILQEKGFKVTQRTIQRDLKTLAAIMPGLQVDDEKDFPGWFWKKDTMLHDVPIMDSNLALTFKLADHFLQKMFPPAIINQLKPYFDSADAVLKTIDNRNYQHWQEKVRILSRTQQLIPATIREDVVAVIYEALFNNKQFRGRYLRMHGDEVEYDLHPLGLIYRESVVYLVATVWDYHDPRHFALHRFKHCELSEQDSKVPESFDLDSYIAAGSFEYGETDNETIQLKAVFFAGAGRHLQETPLSSDQVTTELEEGQIQVEATVKDSGQLRWWLLGFGSRVEVLEPEALRTEFGEIAEEMFAIYRGNS